MRIRRRMIDVLDSYYTAQQERLSNGATSCRSTLDSSLAIIIIFIDPGTPSHTQDTIPSFHPFSPSHIRYPLLSPYHTLPHHSIPPRPPHPIPHTIYSFITKTRTLRHRTNAMFIKPQFRMCGMMTMSTFDTQNRKPRHRRIPSTSRFFAPMLLIDLC